MDNLKVIKIEFPVPGKPFLLLEKAFPLSEKQLTSGILIVTYPGINGGVGIMEEYKID